MATSRKGHDNGSSCFERGGEDADSRPPEMIQERTYTPPDSTQEVREPKVASCSSATPEYVLGSGLIVSGQLTSQDSVENAEFIDISDFVRCCISANAASAINSSSDNNPIESWIDELPVMNDNESVETPSSEVQVSDPIDCIDHVIGGATSATTVKPVTETGESTTIPSYTGYCPDFSDICDESYSFWKSFVKIPCNADNNLAKTSSNEFHPAETENEQNRPDAFMNFEHFDINDSTGASGNGKRSPKSSAEFPLHTSEFTITDSNEKYFSKDLETSSLPSIGFAFSLPHFSAGSTEDGHVNKGRLWSDLDAGISQVNPEEMRNPCIQTLHKSRLGFLSDATQNSFLFNESSYNVSPLEDPSVSDKTYQLQKHDENFMEFNYAGKPQGLENHFDSIHVSQKQDKNCSNSLSNEHNLFPSIPAANAISMDSALIADTRAVIHNTKAVEKHSLTQNFHARQAQTLLPPLNSPKTISLNTIQPVSGNMILLSAGDAKYLLLPKTNQNIVLNNQQSVVASDSFKEFNSNEAGSCFNKTTAILPAHFSPCPSQLNNSNINNHEPDPSQYSSTDARTSTVENRGTSANESFVNNEISQKDIVSTVSHGSESLQFISRAPRDCQNALVKPFNDISQAKTNRKGSYVKLVPLLPAKKQANNQQILHPTLHSQRSASSQKCSRVFKCTSASRPYQTGKAIKAVGPITAKNFPNTLKFSIVSSTKPGQATLPDISNQMYNFFESSKNDRPSVLIIKPTLKSTENLSSLDSVSTKGCAALVTSYSSAKTCASNFLPLRSSPETPSDGPLEEDVDDPLESTCMSSDEVCKRPHQNQRSDAISISDASSPESKMTKRTSISHGLRRCKTVRELLQEKRRQKIFSRAISRNAAKKKLTIARTTEHKAQIVPSIADQSSNTTDSTNQKKPSILVLNPSSTTMGNRNVWLVKNSQVNPTGQIVSNASNSPGDQFEKKILEVPMAEERLSEEEVDNPVTDFHDDMSDTADVKTNAELQQVPPFFFGRVDAKEHRPRHYELVSLSIGSFEIQPKSTQKASSKLKVVFTKRQFLYEFPLSSEHVASSSVEMACIVVPFKTVMAMSCKDDEVKIQVNCTPWMFVGEVQQRTGIISSLPVFDTSNLVDISGGEASRCSIHVILLKKNQADKLQSYLVQFDKRFQILTQLPINQGTLSPSNMHLPLPGGNLEKSTLKRNAKRVSQQGDDC